MKLSEQYYANLRDGTQCLGYSLFFGAAFWIALSQGFQWYVTIWPLLICAVFGFGAFIVLSNALFKRIYGPL